MPVVVSLFRAVNVGGYNRMPMQALRAVYDSLGLLGVQTYVQSGNVVCRTPGKDIRGLAARIADAVEAAFGFRPAVVLRTVPELRAVVEGNPFAGRKDVAPNRLLVSFLDGEPGPEAPGRMKEFDGYEEELRLAGRELYIHYPDGAGRSKLTAARLDRALGGVTGTARNWNTVLRLLELAEALEASPK
jgi:uncharacterized protein (DUF1697 family)